MSGIGKSAAREELENCREKVRNMISHYLREDRGKGRMGALKFLENLYICDVAVSSRSRKGYPAFMEYVDRKYLTVDEEVLSYFDCKKNMDAFFSWEKKLLYQQAYEESFGFPPFLLLQKAQTVKDTAMVRYLTLADYDEDARKDEADDKAQKEKEDAYLEWLYSIAFFEICVREYAEEVRRIVDDCTDEEASQNISEKEKELIDRFGTMDKVYQTLDAGKIQEWEQETQQLFFAWVKYLNELYFGGFFFKYCFELIQDSFASLRVLVLIEYVNVNTTVRQGIDLEKITLRDSEYRIAHEEAKFWEKTVNQWLQNENGVKFANYCFAMMDTWNRNRADSYKRLNNVARRVYSLTKTQTGRSETQVYFLDALKEYISIMENWYIDTILGKNISPKQWEKMQEEMEREKDRIQEIRAQLAMPIWREMDREG